MITIEGYSGCGICVFRNPEPGVSDYILEKSTDVPSYVPRLLLQQAKQSTFSAFNKLPYVVVPPILYVRQETKEEIDPTTGARLGAAKPLTCAVGMQFLHHVDALTFLAKASMDRVRGFSATLLGILDQYVEHSPITDVPASVFTAKLVDIQRIVGKNHNIPEAARDFVCNTVVPALLAALSATAGGQVALPLGQCHGDLTLSNILIASQDDDDDDNNDGRGEAVTDWLLVDGGSRCSGKGGCSRSTTTPLQGAKPVKVVLIDFLDNFVESPLADMAKMCQDLKYAWSIRVSNQAFSMDTVHFFTVLEYLLRQMETRYEQHRWYRESFRLMFVMNQLRVLQYSKDAKTAMYLAATVREEFDLWQGQRDQQQQTTEPGL